MNKAEIIEVAGINSGYGRIDVLREVSFTVRQGECLGILGHNGMGKTTLLRTIMGHLRCHRGHICFEGQAIEHLPTHRRAWLGLGYVPQGRQIFSALTVRENLQFAVLAKRGALDIIEQVLEEFPELKRLLDRPGGTLSGGEQQLLALARALCGQPKLLLLDEPTEGIQPSIVSDMIDRLHSLRLRYGLTILLVEQNFDFIRNLADRALWIYRGQIGKEIPKTELANPSLIEEFVAGF